MTGVRGVEMEAISSSPERWKYSKQIVGSGCAREKNRVHVIRGWEPGGGSSFCQLGLGGSRPVNILVPRQILSH